MGRRNLLFARECAPRVDPGVDVGGGRPDAAYAASCRAPPFFFVDVWPFSVTVPLRGCYVRAYLFARARCIFLW